MTHTLAAWLHTLDPYAIQLWEGGPIRWYGLSYLLGFFLAFLLIRRVARVGASPLDYRKAGDLIVTIAVGIVVGGRLGYVVFYSPSLLWEFSGSPPFWGVLNMMGGGMASHGGILGGIAATWWFARRNKLPWPHLLDLMAFGGPLGLFCGRVANFINGELYGRVCAKDFPLAVQFPQELYDDAELYYRFESAAGGPDTMPANALAAIQAGSERLQLAAEMVLPFRHPSQLYAGVLEGLVVFGVLALLWVVPRKPGLIGGAFCVTYAVMRLINEQFRMPDLHLGEQPLGLTRGQWLSVPLFLLGVVVMVVALRSKRSAMGGWRRGPWTVTDEAEAETAEDQAQASSKS